MDETKRNEMANNILKIRNMEDAGFATETMGKSGRCSDQATSGLDLPFQIFDLGAGVETWI